MSWPCRVQVVLMALEVLEAVATALAEETRLGTGRGSRAGKQGWSVERIRRQKSQDLATGCWEGGGGRGGAESDSEFSTRVTKNTAGP